MTRASLRYTMNHRDLLGLFRSSHRACSVKKVFLKFRKFHRKTPVLESLLITLQVFRPASLLKRYSNTDISYEISEIFKNTYFEEHLRKAASVCFTSKYYKK